MTLGQSCAPVHVSVTFRSQKVNKMNKTEFTKETMIKLWDLSIKNMTPDVGHEVSETPLISSYSVQLPSFLEEPILCTIQIFKLQGDKPKISIIVGNYIEFTYFEITDDELNKREIAI